MGQELVALAINLGSNKRNVEHITEEELHGLVDRALRCEDTKLLKFCRNILQNSENKQLMEVGKSFLKEFIKIAMTKAKNE